MIETLMHMDPATIATFVVAGILLNLTPGADVVFASVSGVAGGWRTGVAAAFGITLGSVVHLTFAAIGLSALILAHPMAYDAIRYVGAAYLLYLAVKAWRADPTALHAQGTARLLKTVQRGFLTNVLNPKVALFILAFLPQFTDPAAGPIWHQIIILGAMFSLTGFLITSCYGALAGLAGTAMTRASSAFQKLTAIVFGGLAARLLLD